MLVVLIDDAGFGNPSTFGGPVSTPAMTRVAGQGLTYNGFHVTALCSPSRAALLTGRNHHTVGFGQIGELPAPFPGYSASVPKDCAPFVRALQGNGYSTAGFGKWHLTPDRVQGAAGPFERWPNAWGFDHFWGILGGEAGQYDPLITQDNTTLGVPKGTDTKEYYWPDDLTDQAVRWLHQVRAQDHEKPWFIYYSTGCSHAPHQVSSNGARISRQVRPGVGRPPRGDVRTPKALGVMPPDTVLTPRPDALPAWDLSPRARRSCTRDRWRSMPASRRTPTGTSAAFSTRSRRWANSTTRSSCTSTATTARAWRGVITGSFNELDDAERDRPHRQAAALADPAVRRPRRLGHRRSDAPHYASAWAWAGNTPFQWGKQCASHLGGTRNGMVISWPERIKDAAGLRAEFTHAIDIGPTILEAAGIPEPKVVLLGPTRSRWRGTSFLHNLRGRRRTGAPHRAVLRDRR